MSKTILVADDDRAMLGLYDRIFSNTDFSVSKAETFAEAAGLLRERKYDLLITDFMFPDGLGTELIRLFREAGGERKSLLVTGTPYAIENLRCEGDYCFVEKPFKVERFMELVQTAIG
ncbi:MAG: hypothetical protein CVU79_10385 [Elusimicrobia bacterium HGW-Elusimicrobia-3]|nr:MAG: hypothetical protein CVU79_10385 [Elusimicrobia bacterium HGW-Elusimicrobia-3]